jgi:hypothetical protein
MARRLVHDARVRTKIPRSDLTVIRATHLKGKGKPGRKVMEEKAGDAAVATTDMLLVVVIRPVDQARSWSVVSSFVIEAIPLSVAIWHPVGRFVILNISS